MATNVVEEADHSVYDWLNQYTTKLNAMSPTDRARESRQDYHEAGQAAEERKYHAREQKYELTKAFIYRMSKLNQKLLCKCGETHVLTLFKNSEDGDTVTDDPTDCIYGKCWYHKVSQVADHVLKLCEDGNTSRQPTVIENVMIDVMRWKMVDESLTPYLLPFDAFKRIWWDLSSRQEQTRTAKALLAQITSVERQKIEQQHDQHTVIIPDQQRKKLLDFPHSDHGLHNLRNALTDAKFSEVWSFINRWRAKVGKPSDAISLAKLDAKMLKCKLCQHHRKHRRWKPKLSVMGIYYAPPGLGKTTALDEGLLVGLDTDWVGLGPTWRDYSPILNLGIPIITNQYTAFRGCGLKVLGVIGPRIRKDTHGNPFTSVAKLQTYAEQNPREVAFIHVSKGKYMSDYVTQLQMLAVLQSIVANYSINLLPFCNNEQDSEWADRYPKLLRKEAI